MTAFDRFLTSADAVDAFGDARLLQAMFDFEAALARAQAAEGLVPADAARVIAGMCRAELYDLPAIVTAGAHAGSLAIPLVQELTKAVALFDASAAAWVHWGSTSQDVIDTAMALATRRALALLDRELAALCGALLPLARAHAADAAPTPLLARTLLQPAGITSFGWKAVHWLAPLVRSRVRLREAAERALALQLGGAVGTRAALGDKGAAVAARMADALQLRLPPTAWHTQRDDWLRLGMELAVTTGSLGKFAKDLSLMAQGEIAELAEGAAPGRGGSTAMPHKRNPVGALVGLAAAHRAPQQAAALLAAMPQEHERGLGNWQAELAEWPALCASACGAASALAQAAAGLEVDAARMRENIDAQLGLVFADAAQRVIAAGSDPVRARALLTTLSQRARAERRPLLGLVDDAVAADPALRGRIDGATLHAAFDPLLPARAAAALARPQLDALEATLAGLPPAPWTPLPD